MKKDLRQRLVKQREFNQLIILKKRGEIDGELHSLLVFLRVHPNCMVDEESIFGKHLLKVQALSKVVDSCIRHNNLISMVLDD